MGPLLTDFDRFGLQKLMLDGLMGAGVGTPRRGEGLRARGCRETCLLKRQRKAGRQGRVGEINSNAL